MNPEVRSAAEADAARVMELYREFTEYLRALGDDPDARLTQELFRRHGFGPNAAFHTLVAECDRLVVGYLLYHFGYDAELATRTLCIVDLYAARNHRGQASEVP